MPKRQISDTFSGLIYVIVIITIIIIIIIIIIMSIIYLCTIH
jgi:hypothetical protein